MELKNTLDIYELAFNADQMWRIDSIVVDNKMGELVDFDENALAKAILRIYHSKYYRKCIRQYARDDFSKNAVAAKPIEIYRKA